MNKQKAKKNNKAHTHTTKKKQRKKWTNNIEKHMTQMQKQTNTCGQAKKRKAKHTHKKKTYVFDV